MRRISVRALGALTLVSAAALSAPALAGSTDYLLKLGGVEGDTKAESQDDKHKNQIEILSYSWGATGGADALTDGLLVLRNSDEPSGTAAKVSKVEAISIKQSTHAASGGGHGAGKVIVHDVSVTPQPTRANDRLRNAGPKEGWPSSSTASRDMAMKGSKISDNGTAAPGRRKWPSLVLKQGAAESGGVQVAAGDVTGDGRGTSAPAHLNRTRQKELTLSRGYYDASAPPAQGKLTILASGAGRCVVGARYPTLELSGLGKRYLLEDARIAGCGRSSAAEDMPTEEITFVYGKLGSR